MTIRLSDAGMAFLVEREGIRLKPYRDSAGKLSVGAGHLIKPGEHFGEITVDAAFALLRADIAITEAALNRLVKVLLTQNQADALLSLIFNIGTANFSSSTLLRRLNDSRFAAAAGEFPRWCLARDPATGKPARVKGLLDRRNAEMKLFLTPDSGRTPK